MMDSEQRERLQSIERVIQRLEADPENLKAHWSLPPAEARFLSTLAAAQQARHILEVGTSMGYSTLWLALAAVEAQGHVETIEASEERWTQAVQYFEMAGLQTFVTAHRGDACEVLAECLAVGPERYDFIFLDAAKAQYLQFFHYSEQLLKPGGLLVADNTQSHRSKMTDFIERIGQAPGWQVSDLQTPNGLIVARKSTLSQD